ncbi:hypothetical protein V6N11_038135 [Hibiscus sabdariffa]|uniref:Uncharacterized protein n=1 Tax=Hibiscus sabdariffa TaxID=183260 RepID=A0ABR2SJT6_9ROSI
MILKTIFRKSLTFTILWTKDSKKVGQELGFEIRSNVDLASLSTTKRDLSQDFKEQNRVIPSLIANSSARMAGSEPIDSEKKISVSPLGVWRRPPDTSNTTICVHGPVYVELHKPKRPRGGRIQDILFNFEALSTKPKSTIT